MYKHPIAFLSVNNLTTARYAAAMMVDYVGFCLDNNKENFITVGKAREIMGWLSGVKFIGEFYNRPVDEILAIGLELKLDMVLLYGDYTETELSSLPFKKIVVSNATDGNLILKDEMILEPEGEVFAIAIYSENEDETGVIDFSEITEKLEALEI